MEDLSLIDVFVSPQNEKAAGALFALYKGNFTAFLNYLLPQVLPDLDDN